MQAGPIIEFLNYVPALVSAGHDGFFPFEIRPFDEIFVIARKEHSEHSVEFWLPHGKYIYINSSILPWIKVHKSGVLWHDRTREVEQCLLKSCWLSAHGFTQADPRNIENVEFKYPAIFAVLPGSPMRESITDLLRSKEWRAARDFHTRHRHWMPDKMGATRVTHISAKRYERDKSLIKKLKQERGSACQICGFSFTKQDGADYCEAHHLEWLSDGGFDVSSNMLILCANCHRRFHYGNIHIISHTTSQIVVEIDGGMYACTLGKLPDGIC